MFAKTQPFGKDKHENESEPWEHGSWSRGRGWGGVIN